MDENVKKGSGQVIKTWSIFNCSESSVRRFLSTFKGPKHSIVLFELTQLQPSRALNLASYIASRNYRGTGTPSGVVG